MPKVALVQLPSPFLDRAGAFEVADRAITEAHAAGAELVVFPETFIGGYPDWIWRLKPADFALNGAIHERLLAASIDLEADELRPLRESARRAGVTVVCGIHERDGAFSRATLYNTVVTIGADGAVLNRHRKLVPTNPERMVWGAGDATGLKIAETSAGRLGALICWENYMLYATCDLARVAVARRTLDVAGHYNRPDFFHLEVNRSAAAPIHFADKS